MPNWLIRLAAVVVALLIAGLVIGTIRPDLASPECAVGQCPVR